MKSTDPVWIWWIWWKKKKIQCPVFRGRCGKRFVAHSKDIYIYIRSIVYKFESKNQYRAWSTYSRLRNVRTWRTNSEQKLNRHRIYFKYPWRITYYYNNIMILQATICHRNLVGSRMNSEKIVKRVRASPSNVPKIHTSRITKKHKKQPLFQLHE